MRARYPEGLLVCIFNAICELRWLYEWFVWYLLLCGLWPHHATANLSLQEVLHHCGACVIYLRHQELHGTFESSHVRKP